MFFRSTDTLRDLFCCWPEALMNLSGPPVASALSQAGLPSTSLVVLHDSLGHKSLAISPKFGGSANGHNGIRSIMTASRIGSDFHRLRLGIGKNEDQNAADYVMASLSPVEREFWGPDGKGVDAAWKHIEKIIRESS